MADFRRVLTALAVLALLTGFASAQTTPFSCNATAVPPTLRAEGVTELVGDIVLLCTGGTPAVAPIPTANFQVFIGNTTVTSRALSTGTEALLLVDDAAGGITVGTNTFQGVVSSNSVTFIGVPVNPPGTAGGTRIFRITNVRINASAIGTGFSGSQVLAFVSISGSTSIPVNNAQLTVGIVQPGMAFSVRNSADDDTSSGLKLNQCEDKKPSNNKLHVRFAEGFATAFKVQLGNGQPGQTAANQATPGAIYNTESGLTLTGGTPALPSGVGVADFGTRLRATFRNIPTGVTVYVATGSLLTIPGTTPAAPAAVLVANDSTVNAAINVPFKLTKVDTFGGIDVFKLTVDSTGTAVAVWEVQYGNALSTDNYDFPIFFGYAQNAAGNSPPAGVQGTVAGAFGPTSTSSASKDLTVPVPRFADTSTPKNVIIVNICRTTLLYPFVTAADGFDTGIAISNTTNDGGLYDTPQSGTCTLNFYGDNAPSAFTTPSPVAGGTVYVNVASGIAPGFRGYMIARCNFQHAHGFAFVQSTVGYTPSTAAMGYLPLVMVFDRPGNEALDN